MPWRQHGRAEVDAWQPRSFGVCDRCGFLYNLDDLKWQKQYAGVGVVSLEILVCDRCLDRMQPQLTATILPIDPEPIMDPRPEYYAVDEVDYLVDQNGDILVDQDGNKIVANVASENYSDAPSDPNRGPNPPNSDQ